MGWPSCNKTPPVPNKEASEITSKGFEKSGNASTGAEVKACLRPLKDAKCSDVSVSGNFTFFSVNLCKGAAKAA